MNLNGRIIKIRLHVHQHPDSERSKYCGGPLGEGYLDGSFDDLKYLESVKPEYIEANDAMIKVVKYKEANVMWEQDNYVHGIMHLTWE